MRMEWSSIWTNHPGCFSPNMVEIGPAVLKTKIFKIRQRIFAIWLLSPLENSGALHLKKIESHSPKDALCQVWLKLAQWFWRRRFFNFVNVFLLFCYYLPLEKGGALLLNKLESPSPKDALCQVWLKFAQWFWRRWWKCEKFTDGWTVTWTGGWTDRRRTTGDQKNSLELSAQVS